MSPVRRKGSLWLGCRWQATLCFGVLACVLERLSMNSIRAGESAKRFYILGTWVKGISLKRLIRSMASSWYDMSWVSLVFHSPIPLSIKKAFPLFIIPTVSILLSIQSYCFNNQLSLGSQVKTSTYHWSCPRRWKRIRACFLNSHLWAMIPLSLARFDRTLAA